jgi:hypothetical protein
MTPEVFTEAVFDSLFEAIRDQNIGFRPNFVTYSVPLLAILEATAPPRGGMNDVTRRCRIKRQGCNYWDLGHKDESPVRGGRSRYEHTLK